MTAAAPHHPAETPLPHKTFVPVDDFPLLSSRRQAGWSAANQRMFLEAIAEGYGVDAAVYRVGLSASSAYAFRRTAKGAAFALGWRAATLVARDTVADTLMVRALDGQVDTYTRADGSIVTRHRHDNRLAMSLLARLDRQVESAPDADVKAARLVAQEFDAFLDLVSRDEGPAHAGLFIARRCGGFADPDAGEAIPAAHDLAPIYALAAADRLARTGVATAAEVDVSDLDPAARAGWTAEQWSRAEAAGLVALACPAPAGDPVDPAPAAQETQHSRDDLDPQVWWDDENGEWRTRFPPPAGFDGEEWEEFGHVDYERTLTDEEAALMGADPYHFSADECAAVAAEHAAFLAMRAPESSFKAACSDEPLEFDAENVVLSG